MYRASFISHLNVDYDVMVKLYKTLVRPIIEYNNVLWGPFYVSDNQKIERIQRKATRTIPSISHLSYHNRLRHLNLPSLQHRRRRDAYIRYLGVLMILTINYLYLPLSLQQEVTQRNYSSNIQIHTRDLIFY